MNYPEHQPLNSTSFSVCMKHQIIRTKPFNLSGFIIMDVCIGLISCLCFIYALMQKILIAYCVMPLKLFSFFFFFLVGLWHNMRPWLNPVPSYIQCEAAILLCSKKDLSFLQSAFSCANILFKTINTFKNFRQRFFHTNTNVKAALSLQTHPSFCRTRNPFQFSLHSSRVQQRHCRKTKCRELMKMDHKSPYDQLKLTLKSQLVSVATLLFPTAQSYYSHFLCVN